MEAQVCVQYKLGCPSKLVSYRNNWNWDRNLFRHYPKQDVCFGWFALISKQGVSVFRNNNKQKTNRNSSKFFKISTFLLPHTISSVSFSCFDTVPKHRNKPKETEKKLVSQNTNRKTTETDQVSVCSGSNWEDFLNCFEDPPIKIVCWRFFRFVSTKFRLFRYRSETPKQTETNRKKCFLVSRNKPKNNRNRLSFGLFRLEPKKIDCFEDPLV